MNEIHAVADFPPEYGKSIHKECILMNEKRQYECNKKQSVDIA